MQTLQRHAHLAVVVAGRRVVQPFHTSSLLRRAVPVSNDPRPSSFTDHDVTPPSYSPAHGKRHKTSLPAVSKAKRQSRKSTQGPNSIRKTNSGSLTLVRKSARKRTVGRDGFIPDTWSAGWGKDELAPPPSAKYRPYRKKIARSVYDPSSSTHPFPPYSVPHVRRTEGYISADAQECNSVLRDVESPTEHKPIARLAHGLDRVLFNPGVYWLRDPRSRIYNFTPWLESIPAVTDFAFERVTGFIKSSLDNDLWKIAKQHKRSFAGSTSSLTGLLGHCYFLISGDKDVHTTSLSRAFVHQPTNFTPGQRMPTSVVLNYREGVWLIDSDKTEELADKNILTWMGTMLEKFLTVPEEKFKGLLRSTLVTGDHSDTRREAYRYAISDQFVMRSQLDCVDPRLPGTGVFDIKTRAAVPIRLDILNYEENSGYLIKTLTGPLESFEKEYYDLIRSAFLKYSFQARIGNMDGILVAYHNTARIFGFQYVSLEEMEGTLYGPGDGARVFNKCVSLLERVLSDVVSVYGERSIKCTFETREFTQELNVFIQPVEWDEQVEGKPCPITELDIRVASYLDDREVKGARAVANRRECEWTVHWTLTEPALDQDIIRGRLAAAHDRQFRALNFPAGIETIEEMEKAWAKIDFGGRHSARETIRQEIIAVIKELESQPPSAHSGNSARSEQELSNVEAVPDQVSLDSSSRPDSPSVHTSTFPSRGFCEPDDTILQLRQLAIQGREETLKEEAEGREKVVWGSVDGWCNGRVQQEEEEEVVLGSGTLPDADESAGAVSAGGMAVGGNAEADVLEDGRRTRTDGQLLDSCAS